MRVHRFSAKTDGMMDDRPLRFFDANCAFGPYRTRVFRHARTAAELVDEMDFTNIRQALVYHTTMRFDHPAVGNDRVVREVENHSRLVPTWALLPSQTGEQPPLETILRAVSLRSVRALWLFPDEHRYSLDELTWGDQMSAYMELRIPLIIRANLDRIAALLRSFPRLVVITGSQGSNPLDRYAWPLVETYPNLVFETSGYLVDGGIEEFCRRYSASRLVFGSGFPDNASGAAMLTLARAEISETDRRAIAWDNLTRILAEASPA
jgi:predicted TIM-barrel fold metal-dependent hydrolase